MNRKIEFAMVTVAVLVIAVTFAWITAVILFPDPIENLPSSGDLKRFTSHDDMKAFFEKANELQQNQYEGIMLRDIAMPTMAATGAKAVAESTTSASDYSTTNIQVAGVDEADFIKNDGKYIYIIPQDGYGSVRKVLIVDAYPAEDAEIVSAIEVDGTPMQLYVNEDRLIVFGQRTRSYPQPLHAERETVGIAADMISYRPYGYEPDTFIEIYDISDRLNPSLERNLSFTGNYYDSRMIGEYVYAIINTPAYYNRDDGLIPLPEVTDDGVSKEVLPTNVYYFDMPDYSYNYLNIIAVNAMDENEKISMKTFLAGYSNELFVSQDNIYLTNTKWKDWLWYRTTDTDVTEEVERTVINKIAIKGRNIEYKGKGSVPGTVLNQFSMDESDGYFRIATTVGDLWSSDPRTMARNNVYVLDSELNVVGTLEDLAPGEKIYSVRFMGARAYIVTFKKVDPLFVIDLSEPTSPEVLGKLKIPGYSDYLHPYDENHIIGLGKEAVEASENEVNSRQLNFAWYQGIKIALFDVTDPENPIEMAKYNIGDRGTDSEALHEHKAFLFDRKKNLIVIPIQLAEINEDKYAGEIPANAYGETVWTGAYVLNLDLEDGFTLKGRVSHVDDDSAFKKAGDYYYDWYGSNVRRSLFMDDVLYTVSNSMIKMNDLADMSDINSITISEPNKQPYPVLY